MAEFDQPIYEIHLDRPLVNQYGPRALSHHSDFLATYFSPDKSRYEQAGELVLKLTAGEFGPSDFSMRMVPPARGKQARQMLRENEALAEIAADLPGAHLVIDIPQYVKN